MATLNYNNVSMEIPIPSNYTNNTGYISQLPYTAQTINDNQDAFVSDYSGKLMSAIEINWGNAHSDEQESFPAYINSSLDIVAGMSYLNSRTTYIYNKSSSHETEIGNIKADINKINNTYIYKMKNDISSLNERVNNAHFEYQYFTIEVEDQAVINIDNMLRYIFLFDNNNQIIDGQIDEPDNLKNIVFEYSYNGENWEAIEFGDDNSFSHEFNKKILLRCDCSMLDETSFGNHTRDMLRINVSTFDRSSRENFKVYGNIMSLIYGENFIGKNDFLNKVFDNLFTDSFITDAKNLILPTTVILYCYNNMFANCTKLISAPKLPAKELKRGCYDGMFSDCESLENAPDLPATILTDSCYKYMFTGCTSLKSAPNLPAKQLKKSCYESMFDGCAYLENAPVLPAITMKENCYRYMFNNCKSLENTPDLPGMIMAENCYKSMFEGCTNLKSIPNSLPSTSLAKHCYDSMFKGCTYLNVVLDLPATDLTEGCYAHMFENCKNLKKAPELKADLLYENCYAHMFNGCTSLNYIRMLGFYYFNVNDSNIQKLIQPGQIANIPNTEYLQKCMPFFAYNVSNNGVFYRNRMYPDMQGSQELDLPVASDMNLHSGYPNNWATKKDIGISVINEIYQRHVGEGEQTDQQIMNYPLNIEDMQMMLADLSTQITGLSNNLETNIERLADTEQRIDRVSQQAAQIEQGSIHG